MTLPLELIVSGFGLLEAPRTDPTGRLWFSDAERGHLHRLEHSGKVVTLIQDRSIGGLVFHKEGGIIVSGPSVAYWKDGEFQPILQLDGVASFNDLHTDAKGRVYVGSIRATDLTDLRHPPEETGELYRIGINGEVEQLRDGIGVSNGIGLSPDGTKLYHVDSTSRGLWVHGLDPKGDRLLHSQHIGTTIFKKGLPDGMCVDEEGNIWVAHVAGHRVVNMSTSGEELDQIPVPARSVTSCAFGGQDNAVLYIVSADNTDNPSLGGCIWTCTPAIKGHPTPLARIRIN